MKLTMITLLAAVLLVPTTTMAADAPEPDSLALQPTEISLFASLAEEGTLTTDANACGADGDLLLTQNGQEPSQAGGQFCGSCSTSNCNGAFRGQLCWLGWRSGGWGNCNIYLGNVCSTGGFKCRCLSGPIP